MDFVFHVINIIIIYAIVGISLNLILGYAGLISMAHAAFFGIGAYTTAIISRDLGLPFPLTLIIAIVVTMFLSGIIALPALRVHGEYLILLTLALQMVFYGLASSWVGFTAGRTGISGITRPIIFGQTLVSPLDFLPLLVVTLIIVFIIAYRIGASPLGRVFKALREDERATLSIGKNTMGIKILVFVIGGGLAAVGGNMFAHYQALVSPFSFSLHQSIIIIAVVVLGGTANVFGSVVGSLLIFGIPEALRFVRAGQEIVDTLRLLIFGLLIVLFMRFRPEGIIPEYLQFRKVRAPETDDSESKSNKFDKENDDDSIMQHSISLTQESSTESEDDSPVLEGCGLSKSFGGIKAASDLNFVLPRRKVTALVGPNGAGKTTLFNLVTSFIVPDSGSIKLRNQDFTGRRQEPWKLSRMGLTRSFQDVRLFEQMTVLENVLVAIPNQPGENVFKLFISPLKVRNADRVNKEKALAYLKYVSLADKTNERASSLSFGEQKLLALARLIATESEVLLLDEPASGVDVYWVNRILKLLRKLADSGKTICIVEHNLEVVTAISDYAYFMNAGEIIAEGKPEDLMKDKYLTEIYFGKVAQ